eukprot:XP_001693611.1 predicted protein [Chlamydomonas reinhardtii]
MLARLPLAGRAHCTPGSLRALAAPFRLISRPSPSANNSGSNLTGSSLIARVAGPERLCASRDLHTRATAPAVFTPTTMVKDHSSLANFHEARPSDPQRL